MPIVNVPFSNSPTTITRINNWFGDGGDDVLAHNATTGDWEIYNPRTDERDSFTFAPDGSGATPAWGKFDGVRTQVASWKDGTWRTKDHDALTFTTQYYGLANDVPLSGYDYNGDGTDGVGIVRPSWIWYINGEAATPWGIPGDVLTPGPWITPGTTTKAVWRPSDSAWYIPAGPAYYLGTTGDIPVPGDLNGDGVFQPCIFRPTTQEWFILGNGLLTRFGTETCTPLLGNWSGTGRWRPAYWENDTFTFFKYLSLSEGDYMAKQEPFHITSGLPFSRTIQVSLPNGRDWWTALVDFEVLAQIREAPAFTAPLLVDLTQFLTTSISGDLVTIELVMTGADTRLLLQNGYYDIMLSDAFTTDERAFVAVSGPVYQSFVVSSNVEETII